VGLKRMHEKHRRKTSVVMEPYIGRKVLEYCPLDINQYSLSSMLPDILRIKYREKTCCENLMMQLHNTHFKMQKRLSELVTH